MFKKYISCFCLFALLILSCKKNTAKKEDDPVDEIVIPPIEVLKAGMVDQKATTETVNLFLNLFKQSRTKVFVGQQDATKRGFGWANEYGSTFNANRSDIYSVTGKFPTVIGSDFMHITSPESNVWFDYEESSARLLAIDAYERGFINTFAWHYHNPVTLGSFYWESSPTKAVSEILPGGSKHDAFKADLNTIADFAKSLIAKDGKLAPFIFRPFHEFDGDWFWWGKSHCTIDEYKELFRFTVTYLRDSLEVHNILYAWSPDRNFNTETQLLERFPGNEYVDLVGMDNYYDLSADGNINLAVFRLNLVSEYAEKNNKLAAFTETGLLNITQADWFTKKLLTVINTSSAKIAYVLFWANRADSYWTPPVGHASANDFIRFCNEPKFILGDKLPSLYHTTP
ncbi:glycoside hydrolase family 26 protein [Gynurincola endophyticus]|uniref:glycoside hydrolase family 26 protein n=1 Tax=Gynurincola endophyticus TaxID=2479004 RepID=UPI0018F6ECF8|nr:glycosyl hydrolase [Gynurincola endophyticus]